MCFEPYGSFLTILFLVRLKAWSLEAAFSTHPADFILNFLPFISQQQSLEAEFRFDVHIFVIFIFVFCILYFK